MDFLHKHSYDDLAVDMKLIYRFLWTTYLHSSIYSLFNTVSVEIANTNALQRNTQNTDKAQDITHTHTEKIKGGK